MGALTQNKVVMLVVALLVVAVFAPIAINTYEDSDELTRTDSFTAATDTSNGEVISLLRTNIVPDSATVTVNATPIPELPAAASLTSDPGWFLTDLTGVLQIASASSDEGDTIAATYDHTQHLSAFGIGGLWSAIGIFGILALAVTFIRGMQGRRKG